MSDHVKERLKRCLTTLATHEGDIRARLKHVFSYDLSSLQPKDFPSGLRTEFEALLHQVTARPEEIKAEGSVRATIRYLSKSECDLIAERLIILALETFASASRAEPGAP